MKRRYEVNYSKENNKLIAKLKLVEPPRPPPKKVTPIKKPPTGK